MAGYAQHITQTINPNIRTLRTRFLSEALEPSGTVSRPYLVLPMNGVIDGGDVENTLEISFDEMSHDVHQYTYRVLHCNRDWTESDISSFEYIDGFTNADIVDYEHSLNTQRAYTHYWLEFPNSDMQIKASGNYVLQIYEDGDPENVVAQVCFSVVEHMVGIDATIRANTDIELNGRYQQLDIDVLTAQLNMRDASEVHVVVQQNGRYDNVVTLNKPTFIEPNRLRYLNQRALIFEAGNEYRHFDIYSSYYAGYNVNRVEYAQGEYHALLELDDLRGIMAKGASREGASYLSDRDANGQWIINCEKSDEVDLEAEYMWVHFLLPVPQPIMDGWVFVGGELFGNQFGARNRMEYDADKKCYYLYTYLKQGGYDYMYYVVGHNGVTALPLEGSHWQTENEYTIWVYYRSFGARYDRLVGCKVL